VPHCRLTPLQETLYQHLLSSKEIRHAREGKQLDTLGAIRQLINICRCGSRVHIVRAVWPASTSLLTNTMYR
jgi:hypothetical protein